MVAQASHWSPSPDRPVAGDVTLLTRDDVDEVRQFYLASLPAVGFDVHDVGIGPLNAPLESLRSIRIGGLALFLLTGGFACDWSPTMPTQ
jgi:hypothetical protein